MKKTKKIMLFPVGTARIAGDDLAIRAVHGTTFAGYEVARASKLSPEAKIEKAIEGAVGGHRIVFLDVVEGLEEVREISPKELAKARTTTTHDVDAGFYIRLAHAMGKKIVVVGIPMGMGEQEAREKVKVVLEKIRKRKRI